MLILGFLIHLVFSFGTLEVARLLQFHPNSTDSSVFGSTRYAIDHQIGDLGDESSSNGAVFVRLDEADLDSVKRHVDKGSPIIFLVGRRPVNTSELEEYLFSMGHKAPIYFAYQNESIPKRFTHVKTSSRSSNSAMKKVNLQNVIGVLNASKSFEAEKIALITAPLDSFSAVPGAKVGVNNNGLALAALLETMHLVSRFDLTNNWVFVFAVTDGHFCHYEGLDKVLGKYAKEHGSKIKFGISLESVASNKLQGLFSHKLKRGSPFAKFMECLLDALKAVNVDFSSSVSEEPKTQSVFAKYKIQSVAITNDDFDETSHITDFIPDVDRANEIAWAVSEALLRMVYDADNTAMMIDRNNVDSGYTLNMVSSLPRMSQFRDQSVVNIVRQWMNSFMPSSINDWSSTKCLAPFSGSKASLILYNPTPVSATAFLFVFAFVYGACVYFIIKKASSS